MNAKSKADATRSPALQLAFHRHQRIALAGRLLRGLDAVGVFSGPEPKASTGPSSAPISYCPCPRRAGWPGARGRGSPCGSRTSGRPPGVPRAPGDTAPRRSGRTFPKAFRHRSACARAGLGADGGGHQFLEPGHRVGSAPARRDRRRADRQSLAQAPAGKPSSARAADAGSRPRAGPHRPRRRSLPGWRPAHCRPPPIGMRRHRRGACGIADAEAGEHRDPGHRADRLQVAGGIAGVEAVGPGHPAKADVVQVPSAWAHRRSRRACGVVGEASEISARPCRSKAAPVFVCLLPAAGRPAHAVDPASAAAAANVNHAADLDGLGNPSTPRAWRIGLGGMPRPAPGPASGRRHAPAHARNCAGSPAVAIGSENGTPSSMTSRRPRPAHA